MKKINGKKDGSFITSSFNTNLDHVLTKLPRSVAVESELRRELMANSSELQKFPLIPREEEELQADDSGDSEDSEEPQADDSEVSEEEPQADDSEDSEKEPQADDSGTSEEEPQADDSEDSEEEEERPATPPPKRLVKKVVRRKKTSE